MEMPTIVGIFTFISNNIYMLSCAEHEKRCITSGQTVLAIHSQHMS